ncbi:cold shock domain-containing protein [Rhodoferax sp. TS-BS-61-7]|uniref:cold shock domain-containing protein n=1 Tax=Rhodoferax sp. TS-BS-61-7 TaxID=2094194 RepID=UPI000CF5ED6D|nr:cold shock domain-containing protein [Rhodoferax sp. TS-BS-61-7]PQA76357.1 cold-shock protein [Rhodoferax sp. TS-BS-61-7]
MDQPRYGGKLKKWNGERGFGFIVADDGGQDIFVHISAFARDGRQPTEGEVLTFEVQPDRNGKRSAVRVRRPGEALAGPAPRRPVRLSKSGADESPGFIGKAVCGLLVCALLWFGYSHYANRAASFESELPALPASLSPAKLPLPDGFRCDGRNMCSQMTSCREATLFLQNCPGMQMDGNGDGIPCEQQWCVK